MTLPTEPRPLPPTLYRDTAAPGPETPPLAGDTRCRVAIVGGGYTGVSAALHLAEAGIDCVLVEAHEVGWGCSGRNGGQVNPGLKHLPDTVEATFGPDLGARMVRLSHAAPDRVFGLVERFGIACEPRRGGTLRAAVDAGTAASLNGHAAQCRARDMPVQLLDAAAMRAATGTGRYRAALFDPRGGSLQPLAYVRGLAAAARGAGARLAAGTRALRLARSGSEWRLETSRGTVTADHVVVATNGYTDDLWPGLRQTIVPVFSAMAATEPLPPEIRAAIMPSGAVLYELGWDTVYYRLDAAGRLLMGGRGPQRDPRGIADCRHLVTYAERLWPALAGREWSHAWAGQVAVTTDHYPRLVEPEPGLHFAYGYNGRGIAMATTMGALLAQRILGAPPDAIDMPVTNTLQPFPLHGFWRVGVAARIAYGRVRDRFAA